MNLRDEIVTILIETVDKSIRKRGSYYGECVKGCDRILDSPVEGWEMREPLDDGITFKITGATLQEVIEGRARRVLTFP